MEVEYKNKVGAFGVLTILVDDEEWRDIHTHIFGKKPSLHTVCKSFQDLEDQFPTLEHRAALNYTMRKLTVKSLPSGELEKNLQERLVSDETIERIISECQRLGYLNDNDWVESFIKRQMARNLGPQAIAMKLRAKNVSQDLIQHAMSKLDNPALQKQRIQHLLQTKYRTRDLTDYKSRSKVVASLARKGFSFQDIQSAIGGN